MKLFPLVALTALTAAPALAEEPRHLDAHEHGVGQLNVAFDGQQIAMELHAPGADIVGFEYAAKSAEDLAAVQTAIATLSQPLELFKFSEAAGCSVVEAAAELESESEHHDEHAHGDGHEDHSEDGHEDHEHEDHAKDDHDEDDHKDHGHEDHAEGAHDHEEEGHEDHAGHTEFHAEYLLTCAEPAAITAIDFAYFTAFPNALEVEVQMISDAGATSFEVERAAPTLDLNGKL